MEEVIVDEIAVEETDEVVVVDEVLTDEEAEEVVVADELLLDLRSGVRPELRQ